VFSAAAKSIQLKIHNSDSEDESNANDNGSERDLAPVFSRTSTGILSNRRPINRTSVDTSGTSTPVEAQPRYGSLLVSAKREAAKRNLYSMFFRGPILGPELGQEPEPPIIALTDRESDGTIGKILSDSEFEGENRSCMSKKGKGDEGESTGSQLRRKKKQEKEKDEDKGRGKGKRRRGDVPGYCCANEGTNKGKAPAQLVEMAYDHDEGRSLFKRQKKESKTNSSCSETRGNAPMQPQDTPTTARSSHDVHSRKRRKRKE